MAVVTISRETGSGGHSVAQKVARMLGYTLVNKDTIGKIYSRFACDEFGIDVGYVPDLWSRFDAPTNDRRALMVDLLNQVILALAHLDRMVIVGRSSFAVLAGFSDVIHARIQAPLATRITRMAERAYVPNREYAETLVQQSDKVRAAFIKGFYGSRWDSAKSFDLVIDTGKISQELAVQWLVQAIQGLSARPGPDTHTLDTIQVVPVLASIVASELKPPPNKQLIT